jgi:cytochrome c5
MIAARRVVAALALAAAPLVNAADAGHGKTLHDRHCTRCHDTAIYARPESTIQDFAALRERVQQCELAAELLWFEEDVDDVAAYLNREYYRLGGEPDK